MDKHLLGEYISQEVSQVSDVKDYRIEFGSRNCVPEYQNKH